MLPNISFDLWIGLHDAQREFQWVEGEPLRHVSWAPGEPSGCSASSPRDKPVSETPPMASPIPGEGLIPTSHHKDGRFGCAKAAFQGQSRSQPCRVGVSGGGGVPRGGGVPGGWDDDVKGSADLAALAVQTNCVVVWHGSPPHFTGRWDDRSCLEEKHGYICQRSIGRGGTGGTAPSSARWGPATTPPVPRAVVGLQTGILGRWAQLGGSSGRWGSLERQTLGGPWSRWSMGHPQTSLAWHVP